MKRFGAKRLFEFPWRTKTRLRDDVEEEFALHLDLRTEALIASGLSPVAAREQAVREFGNRHVAGQVALTIQQRLERRRSLSRLVDECRQDLMHVWRSLRRTPGFTVTAVGILALGVGATTALFGVLSTVLLRPLPYPDAGRLVEIWDTHGGGGTAREATALPDYRAFRDGNRSFDAIGAFVGSSFLITGGDRTELVLATTMTATMWRVLGVQPALGRTFSDVQEQWGQHRVAVISDRLWTRRFNRDATVIGRELRLGVQSFTVLGVMPASFQLAGQDVDLWVPMSFPPGSVMDTRRNRFATVLGRLKHGVTVAQAREDLSLIAARLAREDPQFNAGRGVDLDMWQEQIVGGVRSTLTLLFGAVIMVLLIACANLANLLIARAAVREQELHTRLMLGASTMRLVRQALTETTVVAIMGGVAGLAVAVVLLRGLARVGPIGLPRVHEVTLDGSVMAFTGGLMLLTASVFGLWPAWHAAHAGATGRLRAAARAVTGQRLQQQSRRSLIIAEVSLSLVLLIGATLVIVSVQRLQRTDAGFTTDHLYTATLLRYRPDGRETFVQQVVDAVRQLPGVREAAATTSLPLSPGAWTKQFTADGRPAPSAMAQVPSVNYYHITPNYFRVMGSRLLEGRWFTAQDAGGHPLVAIVNRTLAERMWPGGEAIGKQIAMFPPEALAKHLLPLPDGSLTFPRLTVVGVVGDLRQNGLDQAPDPGVFVPLAQGARAGGGDQIQGVHYLVVRTSGDPMGIAAAVDAIVRQHDRNAALSDVRSMDSRLSDSIARRRFAMLLLGGFAALALLLAVVGLYGVMSYTVSQRRAELGVRAAIGATAGDLLWLVMVDGLRMTFAGAALGLALAVAMSGAMRAELFEIRGISVGIYVAMTVVLVTVAMVACSVPAMRAARIDPATALRLE